MLPGSKLGKRRNQGETLADIARRNRGPAREHRNSMEPMK